MSNFEYAEDERLMREADAAIGGIGLEDDEDPAVAMSDDEVDMGGKVVPMIDAETAARNRALRQNILTMEKTVYDFQKLRIAMGNRIVAANRPDLVTPPQGTMEESDDGSEPAISQEDAKRAKEADSFLKSVCKEYKTVTEAYVDLSKTRAGDSAAKIGGTAEDGAGAEDDPDLPFRISSTRLSKALDAKSAELSIIKDELTYRLVRSYEMARHAELDAVKALSIEVVKHPLWDDFLKDVPGCGPMMAAVIIAEFDIHKARHVSSLWKYAGLDVTPEGEGRNKKHSVMVKYVDKHGNESERKSLGYKPQLKAKLLEVLGTGFLRAGQSDKNKYGQIYYDYKHRISNRPELQKSAFGITSKSTGVLRSVLPIGTVVKTKDIIATVEKPNGKIVGLPARYDGMVSEIMFNVGDTVPEKELIVKYEADYPPKTHIHRMALRYAVKMFLQDLWVHWRALEGYDVSHPYYAVEFLGRKPHGYNEATDGPAAGQKMA